MIDHIMQLGIFAATYGSDPYGSGTYNEGVAAAASNGGSLVTTGVAVASAVTLGSLILFVTYLTKFRKQRRTPTYSRNR